MAETRPHFCLIPHCYNNTCPIATALRGVDIQGAYKKWLLHLQIHHGEVYLDWYTKHPKPRCTKDNWPDSAVAEGYLKPTPYFPNETTLSGGHNHLVSGGAQGPSGGE